MTGLEIILAGLLLIWRRPSMNSEESLIRRSTELLIDISRHPRRSERIDILADLWLNVQALYKHETEKDIN
jgi:hypothetical protein